MFGKSCITASGRCRLIEMQQTSKGMSYTTGSLLCLCENFEVGGYGNKYWNKLNVQGDE